MPPRRVGERGSAAVLRSRERGEKHAKRCLLDFWRSTQGTTPDFATRLAGSRDLYGRGRTPSASINLITAHDGFTLADLV
jgi:pullulanase/glycogen debranching enzyme